MDLALIGVPLPLRLRLNTPLGDRALLRFCAANDDLRVEREANGDLLVMTPAGSRTGRKNLYLLQVLGAWADRDGRGYAFDSSTGFTLADGSMRSPDAAWIEASRWDALSEEEKDTFSPVCPDFVVELRSPSDRLPELQAKMAQWMANGAQLAWLLDPTEDKVWIYRPGEAPERLARPASLVGEGPVAGFELAMAKIWS